MQRAPVLVGADHAMENLQSFAPATWEVDDQHVQGRRDDDDATWPTASVGWIAGL